MTPPASSKAMTPHASPKSRAIGGSPLRDDLTPGGRSCVRGCHSGTLCDGHSLDGFHAVETRPDTSTEQGGRQRTITRTAASLLQKGAFPAALVERGAA